MRSLFRNKFFDGSENDVVHRRALWILFFLPLLLLLPIAFKFGAVTTGDHELVAKLGLIKAIQSGHPIWWTDALDCGTLLLGSTSMPWTLGDFLYLLLTPRWAHNFSHILDPIIAGIGFYLWRVRSHGNQPLASLLGAITFQLSLQPISRLAIGHQVVSSQFAWLPWVLWCMDALLRGRWKVFIIIFPWLLFLMALATYPSTTIVFGMVVLGYVIWRYFDLRTCHEGEVNRLSFMRIGFICLFSSVLGLGLSSFIYFPAFEFAKYCVIPGSQDFNLKDYAYHLSLPIPCVGTLLLPYLFGGSFVEDAFWSNYMSPGNAGAFQEFALYSGLIPLWLLWSQRRSIFKISEARFWFFLGVVMFMISFGKLGGIYPILTYLPVFKNLRGPCRFIVVLPLVLACIATLGSELWSRNSLSDRVRSLHQLPKFILFVWGLAVLVILFVMGGYYFLVSFPLIEKHDFFIKLLHLFERYVLRASFTNLWIISLLALVFGLVIFFAKPSWKQSLGLLCLLVSIDLVFHAYPRLWRPSGNFNYYLNSQPISPILNQLTNHGSTRYVALKWSIPHNLSLLDGTSDICGFKDFVLRWHSELIRKANGENPFIYDFYGWGVLCESSPLLSLMRVNTLVSVNPITDEAWHQISQVGHFLIYQKPLMTPEAWFPRKVMVERDAALRLERLEKEVAGDPTQLALVESESDLLKLPREQLETQVNFFKKKALEYDIELSKPSVGLLCTAIGYYPDWIATDESGMSLTTTRVNHGFLGVNLDHPTQKILIRFSARAHWMGIYISLGCFVWWGIILIISFSPFKKRPQSTES